MTDGILKAFILEYGIWGVVVASVVTLAVSVITYFLKQKIQQKIVVRGNRLNDSTNLKYHHFFTNIDNKIKTEIPSLKLYDNKPVREKIFKDLLLCFLKNVEKAGKQIIEYDVNSWTTEHWTQKVVADLSVAQVDFKNEAKEKGIPEPVILKFNQWNRKTLDMMYENIISLGAQNIYDDNHARTNVALVILNLMLVVVVGDAERSLSELNGEISGMEYNGNIIES